MADPITKEQLLAEIQKIAAAGAPLLLLAVGPGRAWDVYAELIADSEREIAKAILLQDINRGVLDDLADVGAEIEQRARQQAEENFDALERELG